MSCWGNLHCSGNSTSVQPLAHSLTPASNSSSVNQRPSLTSPTAWCWICVTKKKDVVCSTRHYPLTSYTALVSGVIKAGSGKSWGLLGTFPNVRVSRAQEKRLPGSPKFKTFLLFKLSRHADREFECMPELLRNPELDRTAWYASTEQVIKATTKILRNMAAFWSASIAASPAGRRQEPRLSTTEGRRSTIRNGTKLDISWRWTSYWMNKHNTLIRHSAVL